MKNYNVVIAGGGAAGIGLAASLKKRDSSLTIAIIEPSESHYYQPSWTLVGAGEFNVQNSKRLTKDLIPVGVDWIKASITGFNPEQNEVLIEGQDPIHYQQLAVCTGLKSRWDAIPGLLETLGKNGVSSNYSYEFSPYTWELVKELKSGRAIFTQPPLPFKCPGAPQKAMYLSCSYWEKQGVLNQMEVELDNAGGVLFGVADFVPPLMEYVIKYHAQLNFNTNLISVNGSAKTAKFAVKGADGTITEIEKTFDILHVVPPQGAQDCLNKGPLVDASGMVEVDQFTLQHVRYSNVFGLGDCCSTPNSKTAAAARKQIVIVAENLLATRKKQHMSAKYDGYGSCPLTVEKGKIVLAEFGYGGKLLPTFPRLINPLLPSRLAWILKKNILPWLYWNLMLKGREWLARSPESK
jgi:sulfide:quinone oxidoreductase